MASDSEEDRVAKEQLAKDDARAMDAMRMPPTFHLAGQDYDRMDFRLALNTIKERVAYDQFVTYNTEWVENSLLELNAILPYVRNGRYRQRCRDITSLYNDVLSGLEERRTFLQGFK